MKTLLLLITIALSNVYSPLSVRFERQGIIDKFHHYVGEYRELNQQLEQLSKNSASSTHEIEEMLHSKAPMLSLAAINQVVATLTCATNHNVEHNNMLVVIDYSLPSNKKRLWVFSLAEKKLLFHTYVSHGLKSGVLATQYFSNKYNSKASSLGVYKTEKTYYGRHGLSLALNGLDPGFNDNAGGRAVVMHGGWYVNEDFIKRYGRAGRSWGCPAVPEDVKEPLINAIKDHALLVVYYPSERWFQKSKFLTCNKMLQNKMLGKADDELTPPTDASQVREPVLFADIHTKNKHAETEPILVVRASRYEELFHRKPPLERMLRRQINNIEYIALSSSEFNLLAMQMKEGLNDISFVVPEIKMIRGYYATEMKIVPLGKIEAATGEPGPEIVKGHIRGFTLRFLERPAITLRSSNQFIRWLGL
jgi:hypothetical protein